MATTHTDTSSGGKQPDQRQFSRVMFDTPAFVQQDGEQWPATVIDLSLKGLLLKHRPWPVSNLKPVTIDIQLEGKITITMHGHWVHSEETRSGFRCDHIDLDSITHLRRLVELNLGDSKLLERELSHLS
jgi:hypothetical protein